MRIYKARADDSWCESWHRRYEYKWFLWGYYIYLFRVNRSKFRIGYCINRQRLFTIYSYWFCTFVISAHRRSSVIEAIMKGQR